MPDDIVEEGRIVSKELGISICGRMADEIERLCETRDELRKAVDHNAGRVVEEMERRDAEIARLHSIESNYETAQANWDLTLDKLERAKAVIEAARALDTAEDRSLAAHHIAVALAAYDSE